MTKLKDKLIASGIISTQAELIPLQGGVSSDIYLVIDDGKKLVVKQALEKLKVTEDWRADISRNKFELRYLQYVNRFLPDCVPTVLDGNEDSGFFTMEFLGDDFKNLKTEFLEGHINEKAVYRVIDALATIHKKSKNDESVKRTFDSTENFIELRVSPYFLFLRTKFPELSQLIDEKCERLIAKRYCLVHGDFSPKNILINNDRSVLLDCEVAWYGNPAFDMAFFLNHLLLKGIYLKNNEFFELSKKILSLYTEKFEDISADILDLLPMLLLARVAGKSPAEYLDQETKDKIKPVAISFIKSVPSDLGTLINAIKF